MSNKELVSKSIRNKEKVTIIQMGQDIQNGPSKSCRRQPLKSLMWYGLLRQTIHFNFLKTIFQKFYLVYSWIDWPKYHTSIIPITHQYQTNIKQKKRKREYQTNVIPKKISYKYSLWKYFLISFRMFTAHPYWVVCLTFDEQGVLNINRRTNNEKKFFFVCI